MEVKIGFTHSIHRIFARLVKKGAFCFAIGFFANISAWFAAAYGYFFIDGNGINQKLLWGVQGGDFLEKSPPGRRRHKVFLFLYQAGAYQEGFDFRFSAPEAYIQGHRVRGTAFFQDVFTE